MASDIFRMLSRSTRLSRSEKPASLQNYPSSGERARPQIFGEDTTDDALHATNSGSSISNAPKSTRKRKRGRRDPADDVPPEVDFFNAGAVQPPRITGEANSVNNDSLAKDDDTQDSPLPASNATLQMSEDDRRRILRDHKIKVTVLDDWSSQLSTQDTKKRKRATADSNPPNKRKQKTQLYPQSLTSFAELSPRFSLSRRMLSNISTQGYTTPTEVQMASIPLLLDRESSQVPPDLLSVAPTGSGKTLAFLIPTMDAIMRIRKNSANPTNKVEPTGEGSAEDGPLAIILAPTKELANQIVNEARKLAVGTGIKVSLMRKGMGIVDVATNVPCTMKDLADDDSSRDDNDESIDQHPQASKEFPKQSVKAHVIVSTPLVLLHALTRSDRSVAPLPTVRYLILDEADVLLDPLFREQVLSIWNTCNYLDLHVSMWSATMGSNIEALVHDTIAARHSTLTFADGPPSPRPPLLRLVIGLKDTALPTISHKLVYAATEAGKLMALRQLLHPTAPTSRASNDTNSLAGLHPPFLVFTQTIARAVALAAELRYDIPLSAGGEARIAALHSDLSDTARDTIMTGFRRGEIWVLITTDLLARGVDFRGVNGVVNYDIPTSAASYVHRVGRTGRAGREGGVAVTLYAKEDVPFIKPIANIIAMSEKAGAGKGVEGGMQDWLLNSLPTPTKNEKKALKKRGIEERRPGKEKSRISTKSGYDRKRERRGKPNARPGRQQPAVSESSNPHLEADGFEGFDD